MTFSRIPQRMRKPVIVAFVGVFVLALVATAGSLTPSALPAATMHSLANIWDSIASSTYDSSSVTANQNGSLIAILKSIDDNTVWASGSNNIWNLNSGNIGIGTTTPTAQLDVLGYINTDTNSGYMQGGLVVLYASNSSWMTLVGVGAGAALVPGGINNTAVGWSALSVATASDANTALGSQALRYTTTGYYNTAVGATSMRANTTGSLNVALGTAALFANTTGSRNTALGYDALYSDISSDDNTAVGYAAGFSTLGSGNIFLGQAAGYQETGSNTLWIDNQSTASSSAFIYGDLANDILGISANVGIGTTAVDSKLEVAGTASVSGITVRGSTTTPATIDTSAAHSFLNFRTAGTSRGYIGYDSLTTGYMGFWSAAGTVRTFAVDDTGVTLIGGNNNPAITKLFVSGMASIASDFEVHRAGTNNDVLTVRTFTNSVGINNASPRAALDILSPLVNNLASGSLRLTGNREILVINEVIGGIDFAANDNELSVGGVTTAQILAVSTGTTTPTALDTYLVFKTTDATTMAERMRILDTGNIGIGTTTPTSLLHIVGSTPTLFDVASGSNSRFAILETGNVGIASSSPSERLSVNGNVRIENGSLWIGDGTLPFGSGFGGSAYVVEIATISHGGLYGGGGGISSSYILQDSGLGAPGDVGYGGVFSATSDAGNSALIATINGVNVTSNHLGSGLVTNLAGGFFSVYNGDFGGGYTGTVTSMNAVMTQLTAYAGTVNDAAGVRISTPGSTTGIQNLYGLYIEQQSGGVLGSYNIYSAGAASRNYFGGNVSVSGDFEPTLSSIGVTADAICEGPGGVLYQNNGAATCTVSSARYKHNIQDLNVGLAELLMLRPVSFTPNGGTDDRLGLIAEEVSAVEPRLVFYEDDGTTPRGVRYEEFTALLTKAIQEQQAMIDAIRAGMTASPIPLLADDSSLFDRIVGLFKSALGIEFGQGSVKAERIRAKSFELEADDGTIQCVRFVAGQLQPTSGECPVGTTLPAAAPSGVAPIGDNAGAQTASVSFVATPEPVASASPSYIPPPTLPSLSPAPSDSPSPTPETSPATAADQP